VSFLSILTAAASLWVVGAHPVAQGLTRAPWDKLVHLGAFSLISAACGVASGARGWRLLAWCLVCVTLIGGMDEWHQASLPGRTASWSDLVADIAGGFAGAGLVVIMQKWQLRR
jgi:VanZ family protein